MFCQIFLSSPDSGTLTTNYIKTVLSWDKHRGGIVRNFSSICLEAIVDSDLHLFAFSLLWRVFFCWYPLADCNLLYFIFLSITYSYALYVSMSYLISIYRLPNVIIILYTKYRLTFILWFRCFWSDIFFTLTMTSLLHVLAFLVNIYYVDISRYYAYIICCHICFVLIWS